MSYVPYKKRDFGVGRRKLTIILVNEETLAENIKPKLNNLGKRLILNSTSVRSKTLTDELVSQTPGLDSESYSLLDTTSGSFEKDRTSKLVVQKIEDVDTIILITDPCGVEILFPGFVKMCFAKETPTVTGKELAWLFRAGQTPRVLL